MPYPPKPPEDECKGNSWAFFSITGQVTQEQLTPNSLVSMYLD